MTLIKEFEYDCEIRGEHRKVQVRKGTIIKDNGNEVSRTYERHVLHPRTKTSGTWSATDISGEDSTIQAVCNAVWTSAVCSAYEVWYDSQQTSVTTE